MIEKIFLTHENVFQFKCVLKILYNALFFKVLYFFVNMVQQNKIQGKNVRKENFFMQYKVLEGQKAALDLLYCILQKAKHNLAL